MYIPTMFFGAGGTFIATGGDINTFVSGGIEYKSHTLRGGSSGGTFTVLNGSNTNARILVVGGGGGAAPSITFPDNLLDRWYGAAGGAGQLITSSSLTLVKGNYSITIGTGSQNTPVSASGYNGGDTIITGSNLSITAYGGGGGGYKGQNGKNGGSGGGAGPRAFFGTNTNPGQDIYGPFGNDGGQETYTKESNTGYYYIGGGGGGAGGAASTKTGGTGLSNSARLGGTDYYAFGGTLIVPINTPLPPNYGVGGHAGNGANNFGGAGRYGIVVINYPIKTAASSSCYEYNIKNLNGYSIRYTNCFGNEVIDFISSSNQTICRQADTDIFTSASGAPSTLIPYGSHLEYVGPCNPPYREWNVYFGSTTVTACTSPTLDSVYTDWLDDSLSIGTVLYYDTNLNNPLTQSYISNNEFGSSKEWYFISGSNGEITSIGNCFPTGSTGGLTTGSVVSVTDINTGSFYNTQFTGPASLQNIQSTGVTLEIWAKNPSLTQNYDAFIGLWDGQSSPNRDWIEIREDGASPTLNHVLGNIYNQESPSFENETSPSSAVADRNNWYHHIITFDSGSSQLTYFRNGYFNGSVLSSLDPNISYQTVHVGQQEDGPVCNMYVGEYRVYTSSLDLQEVLNNFEATKGRYGY